MQMFKQAMSRIRQSIVSIVVIFILGNTVGTGSAYLTISKDCRILGMFRIGDVAFACHVHTK